MSATQQQRLPAPGQLTQKENQKWKSEILDEA
jgi:hypothetical protein